MGRQGADQIEVGLSFKQWPSSLSDCSRLVLPLQLMQLRNRWARKFFIPRIWKMRRAARRKESDGGIRRSLRCGLSGWRYRIRRSARRRPEAKPIGFACRSTISVRAAREAGSIRHLSARRISPRGWPNFSNSKSRLAQSARREHLMTLKEQDGGRSSVEVPASGWRPRRLPWRRRHMWLLPGRSRDRLDAALMPSWEARCERSSRCGE